MQSIGVSASSSGALLTINSNSTRPTTYRHDVSTGSTSSITFIDTVNGTQTARIIGTITAGDVLTLTIYDSGLGGSKAINYTLVAGDTQTTTATNLAAAINADVDLQAIGVSATSSSSVVYVKSNSLNTTTYKKAISAGATSNIRLGNSTGVQQASYNNVNAITAITPGGAALFEGIGSKPLKSMKIENIQVAQEWSEVFSGKANLNTGTNDIKLDARDGSNALLTKHYQVTAPTTPSATLTHDANGNMTNDGNNSYEWDAENRLIQITYPGIGNNSQFTYDGLGRCVKIVETVASSVASTKQFVWCGSERCEERDGSGSLSNGKQFYPLGQVAYSSGTPTNYFYSQDHLGSTREMTNSAGAIQAQYQYDPYGIAMKLSGSQSADFQYAGYYEHAPSGLNLTLFRAYNPALGRWLSRDPIGEAAGVNLFAYVEGDPINSIDELGLVPGGPPGVPGGGGFWSNFRNMIFGGAGGQPPPDPNKQRDKLTKPPQAKPNPSSKNSMSPSLAKCLEDAKEEYKSRKDDAKSCDGFNRSKSAMKKARKAFRKAVEDCFRREGLTEEEQINQYAEQQEEGLRKQIEGP